jgi:hypothetical protein
MIIWSQADYVAWRVKDSPEIDLVDCVTRQSLKQSARRGLRNANSCLWVVPNAPDEAAAVSDVDGLGPCRQATACAREGGAGQGRAAHAKNLISNRRLAQQIVADLLHKIMRQGQELGQDE